MRRRTRTFIGAVATLAFVIFYALAAMLVAQTAAVRDSSALAQGLVHVLLGLAWILPMLPLVAWMVAPDE